ncbi:hypothetical protein TWF506_007326 [Arthrobotrys conoides]|uniref:Uncharacterized protein n=1 Tax=Arthrobotrys conoides TaxID=74498 RepID=A0AAN8NX74_9PEZI
MSRQQGGLEEGRYGTPTPFNPQHGFNPAGVSEMPSAYNAQSDYYSGQYNPEMSYAYGANGGNALYPDPNPPLQTMPPPQFQDKPPPVAPIQYGATGAGAGAGAAMAAGIPSKEKRICGLRRKVFFIILAVIAVLIIAGLAAGLAIALTRKNNDSSRDRQADGAGAGTASSSSIVSRTTSEDQSSPPSQSSTPFFPSIGPPETTDPITSESSTAAEPTTTEAEETTTTEEPTTEEPTTTPEETSTEETTSTPQFTIAETTSEDPLTTPEDTPTPTRSPEPSSTPPSDGGLITPTLSPETTPRRTSTPTLSAFALETGYNTLDLVVTSTTGNSDLCSLLIAAIPITTTIYPSIVGDAEDLYTAYWELDNYPETLTATGTPPERTAQFQFWSFEVPINNDSGDCAREGGDSMAFEESGVAIYSS